jgi:peroxiredoxin family protein
MTTRPLAVVLASADLLRLYTGLSLLVSARAEGREVSALATFGALAPLLDPELEARALDARATPGLTPAGRETFARSLAELRDLARDAVHVCAAAAETTGAEVEGLAGVKSTPRFLRDAGDAELVVV